MADQTKIIEALRNEEYFYMISHMLPDGDSIGSLLAMGEALQGMGKEVRLFTPGSIPYKYRYLNHSAKVEHEIFDNDPNITMVVLDSSDVERLGIFKDTVLKSKKIINIDHHITNQRFGTLNLVNPEAAATGEIVYDLLEELQVELNESIAESLYVAISTDTGSFKYENTTAKTHRVISSLLEYDLNPGAISQRIFDERSLPFYILLKEALSSIELYEGRRIAVMTLSKDLRERTGATTDDLEGIVNYTRNIEGVELGILFYVESASELKVGFRSKEIDVSELAGRLNGGGHIRAAGCRMQGDFESLKNKVMTEAFAVLKELQS